MWMQEEMTSKLPLTREEHKLLLRVALPPAQLLMAVLNIYGEIKLAME